MSRALPNSAALGDRNVGGLGEEDVVEQTGHGRSGQRCEEERPHLCKGIASAEDRDAERSCRIHRGVRDRDGDEMDESQRESDRQRGEADRGAIVRGSEDDEEEDRGEDEFDDEDAEQ